MTPLLVDVGNSRVKWRAPGAGEGSVALGELDRLGDAWAGVLPTIGGALICNVAGVDVGDRISAAVRGFDPSIRVEAVVAAPAECGVTNGYREAARLGPDRWAAMIGAHARVPHRHLLVCSFGTATTLDLLVLDANLSAVFVGGSILPGVDAMRVALHRGTARLPLARGDAVDFAVDTEDAIESGIVAAQLGAVMRTVEAAARRLDPVDRRGLQCIYAGGWARHLAVLQTRDRDEGPVVVPDLVLRGLEVMARARLAPAAPSRL